VRKRRRRRRRRQTGKRFWMTGINFL